MPAAESCAALLLLAALVPAQAAAGDDAPSRELLLHLAEFGDADDQYVEPLDLESTPTAAVAATPRKRLQPDEAPSDQKPDPDPPDDAPR